VRAAEGDHKEPAMTSPSSRTGRPLAAIVLVAAIASLVALLAPAAPAGAATGDVIVYDTEDTPSPYGLLTTPDGNVWFTNQANGSVGYVNPTTGATDSFGSGAFDGPVALAFASQGIHVANGFGNSLASIGLDGQNATECNDPQNEVNNPTSLVVGPYPRLYFTSQGNDRIGTRDIGEPCVPNAPNTILTYADAQGEVAGPTDIVNDPDRGVLWFTNRDNGRVGRFDPAQVAGDPITTFSVPGASGLHSITFGPDSNLWLTDRDLGTVIRFDPDTHESQTFPIPVNSPEGITAGPDGRLWVAGYHSQSIVRVSVDGVARSFSGGGIGRVTEVILGPGNDIWGASFIGGNVVRLDPGPLFADVSFTHPFYDEIDWMAGEQITTGYDDGTYRPSAPVSRAAMSAFMYRLAGSPPFPPPLTPSFADVPATHPFFLEVEWMDEEGITTGYSDGTFKPGATVTRQSMAAFMYRLADEPSYTPGSTFSDVGANHPFRHEIGWMAVSGVSTGYEDGTFRPSAPVTRSAMSAFMYRLDALL
jgi:streptogramin lyase